MSSFKLTSESVTEGHPDKLCDQISDRILDAYLAEDPDALVAIECMISKDLLVIAGEVKSTANIVVEKIARAVLLEVGYTSTEVGINGSNCLIIKNIHEQSSDIRKGVLQESEKIGAGDQGIMYGFACIDTDEYMPLPITLAHKLAKRLAQVRKNKILPFLLPDGKAQVTVEYNQQWVPLRIAEVVISAQHKPDVRMETLRESVMHHVVDAVLGDSSLRTSQTQIFINPIGQFVLGGPFADTGLTGRKIIVDTYGGVIPHGGGAFSGKDATKVDRSAAYMARYVAKNIVAAKLAKRCQVALSYMIGSSKPSSIMIDTFGTENISLDHIHAIVETIFDFSPKAIINSLSLRKPIYEKTSVYGHFKNEESLPWEQVDKAILLKMLV